MTPLRRRMIEDLMLRDYAERNIEAYVRSVAQLAVFYGRSSWSSTTRPALLRPCKRSAHVPRRVRSS